MLASECMLITFELHGRLLLQRGLLDNIAVGSEHATPELL